MSAITTHVLDLALGRPARGVPVRLDVLREQGGWISLAERVTDDDGRIGDMIQAGSRLDPGTYRLTFLTGHYFDAQGVPAFHPEITVVFRVTTEREHYHVPLLLSAFGYTTYRGS